MKTHYSLAELAEMGLEGYPSTVQAWTTRAKKGNWAFIEVPCKGGKNGKRREYELPPELQTQIRTRETTHLLTQTQPELLPALSETVSGSLKTHDTDDLASSTQAQRNQAGARLGVLHKVEALMS